MASEKDSLSVLIKKRSALKSKLTIFCNYLNMLTSNKTMSQLQRIDLEGRFSKFDAVYVDFDTLQLEIEVQSEAPDAEYAERAQFEERYHALAAQARQLLASAGGADGGSVASSEFKTGASLHNNFIRLPKIDLPHFNGSYQCWLEYRDTYLSLIHNCSSVDDISKFHYLRASLTGKALDVIQNIDFNGDNYEMAWNLLCERYNNSRLLVNNHVQALFNVEHVSKESSSSLRHLVDTVNKNIRALKTLNEPTEYWDTLIVYMMSSKLDVVTSRNWEEYRSSLSKSPSLSQFCTFISNKADLMETLEDKSNKLKLENKNRSFIISNNIQSDNQQLNKNKINNKNLNSKIKCPLCNNNHLLYTCETFRNLPVETRILKVKEFNVCFNCLRSGHSTNRCRLSHCKYCRSKHSTLLHVDQSKPVSYQDPMPSSSSVALPINMPGGASLPTCAPDSVVLSSDTTMQNATSSHILLSTAMVRVVVRDGESLDARILLDNGSTANFITSSLCDRLRLPRRSASSIVSGINNQSSTSTQSCNLIIESYNGKYKENINCFILPEITKILPTSVIDISHLPIPTDLHLADPTYYIPSAIDILVGAEVFWNVLGNACINLGKNQPKLCDTKLGWIVSGPVALQPHPSSSQLAHVCNFSSSELDTNVCKLWELDSVSPKHLLSREERACEKSFYDTTTRDEGGRFVVTLPLKDDPRVLGDSYAMAKRRFLSLERKFERDPAFKDRYVEFMQEYERLGHMTEDLPGQSSGPDVQFFLPHHGVIRESSLTTKLRTVFDASASTTSGLSLNDILMVGPTVQDDLLSILLRFRQHKYVISGDIEKMYRAIFVTPSQRSLQKIIFRANSNMPLKTYTLNTVTYGTASAPYLATKCLVSLADAAINHNVKTSIERDFYVDDLLTGGSSITEVVSQGREISSILASANFYLRKWQSNNPQILAQITGNSESSNTLNLSENKNVSYKTLGLYWLCDSDVLSFSINIDTNKKVTKRNILSTISQVFDPLGLVGPCIIQAKLILQQLWVVKCDWDCIVSQDLQESWTSFAESLPKLNLLRIPRWTLCDDSVRHEIHVFSDASEKAYGACIYLRSVNKLGLVQVQLLVSKNRVAPIKPTTIPRLELCAALLGTRLCTKVRESLTIPIDDCYFWCDSTIVLCWLAMSPNMLKSFVRHRVDEVQENTAGYTWSYVPSRDNPADLVSRGLKADLISECSLWWSGPQFLCENKTNWPKMPNDNVKQDLPEICSHQIHSINNSISFHQSHNHSSNLITSLIHKYSNFNKLQRIMAYIQRFIYNLKNKNNKNLNLLSTNELNDSFTILIRHAQLEMFPQEYNLLKSGKSLPRKNRLLSLSPFLDKNGVIRVGGRLDNSPYEFNVKHPILLCSKHHLTKLVFNKFHLDLLHAGPQLLLANVRQSYWPLGGRNLSKLTVRQCLKCFRYKCTNIQPVMGQLPTTRTQLEFPFLNCSVDYAGPVFLADRKGRGCKLVKCYLCIFVCLSVKAVHIELATDLTKEAFMAALKRFVARRGKPASILSDNGTNFVGASNELHNFLLNSNLEYEVAQEGIEFTFSPPYSPHFNGIAEAAVRSTKHHLKRLLELAHFTYEEMTTCLAQIEAVLNSRPLTPLSSDPLDLSALTPSHFLIGRSLTSVPHPQVTDINVTRLERYQRVEHVKQHFWNRFHLEYVSLLQQKAKWTASASHQLSVGTMVLIRERGQPPLLWPLGRITRVFPGSDGTTRVAEMKTKKGTILRAFNNICPLPL